MSPLSDLENWVSLHSVTGSASITSLHDCSDLKTNLKILFKTGALAGITRLERCDSKKKKKILPRLELW
jgi:hypothetical protein